jgi:CHAT domain-containing protein
VRKANTANYYRVNKDVGMVLEWLWDSIVGPVLDELGFTETPGDNSIWPHVWWVPSGWPSLLPIHAAGYHHDNLCRSALDRVVSSYTTTLKALAFARERATRVISQRTPEVLFVSMLRTPGQEDLPYVVKEVAALSELIPPSIEKHVLSEPTKEDVLLKLRTSSIAHFACHGRNYAFDPSQSSLLLSDWNMNPLAVSDIGALKPEYSKFAYLSACHAASNYTRGLFDEGIHLAGAFQLAGFSQVIGTLWRIEDELSVLVSQGVYRAMLHEFGGIDIGKSAQGLHRAVRAMRNEEIVFPGFTRKRRLRSEPLVWAQYIHIGA